jgi:LysM repeat protein
MFVPRLITTWAVLLALLAAALGAARPSSGAAPETRYVVRPGDTLWTIAAARTDGDVREAVWRIQLRNALHGGVLRPGRVLFLPG